MNKVCYECKVEKAEGEFTHDRRLKDGRKGRCKVCQNKYNRLWLLSLSKAQKEHKDEIQRLGRLNWSEAYKKRRREAEHLYRKTGAYREREHLWRLGRRETLKSRKRKRCRDYQKTDTAKQSAFNARAKRRSQTNGIVTLVEWKEILRLAKGYCYWCKGKFSIDKLQRDHVIPISKGGLNLASNIVPACKPCNSRKNNQKWSLV